LVLDALAEKSDYRSRVTIIVFGRRTDGEVVGRHWIAYAGDRQGHRKFDFDKESFAAKVLSGEENSPCFKTLAVANEKGQNRGSEFYSSFYIFRLNNNAVLSLDWPKQITEDDDYISVARRLLYMDVAPAIGKLLDKWHGPLATEVQMQGYSSTVGPDSPISPIAQDDGSVTPRPTTDGEHTRGGKAQFVEEVHT
jgi:hypothetical protein